MLAGAHLLLDGILDRLHLLAELASLLSKLLGSLLDLFRRELLLGGEKLSLCQSLLSRLRRAFRCRALPV